MKSKKFNFNFTHQNRRSEHMKSIKLAMVFLSIILVQNNVFSQTDVNKLDASGKKHGLWVGTHEGSKRPRYEGVFEHGIEVGIFKYFDDTKAQSLIATREFSQNGKVAYTIFYDQKKNIVSEGQTVNRVNEGVWKYYQKESKQLMTVETYKNGKLEGERKVYFTDGAIAEEAFYKNGKREGLYKVYSPKGVVMEESTFKNDQYNGPAIFREPNGNIASKGNFVKGEKKGVWEFYVNGKLTKTETYPRKVKFEKKKEVPKP